MYTNNDYLVKMGVNPDGTVYNLDDFEQKTKGEILSLNENIDLIGQAINRLSAVTNGVISKNLDGNFHYEEYNIKQGDVVTITMNSEVPSATNQLIWFSNGKRDTALVESEVITITSGTTKTIVASRDWQGITTWGAGHVANKYTYSVIIIRKNIKIGKLDNEVLVASKDAPQYIKDIADYVCTGVNDELVIQAAVDKMKKVCGTVILSDGNFEIQGFRDYTISGVTKKYAICVQRDNYTGSASDNQGGVTIRGCSTGRPQRTFLRVRGASFANVPDSEQPVVIGGGSKGLGYQGGWGFNVEHLMVNVTIRNRKCIAISHEDCYWGKMKACELTVSNFGQDVVPVEGLIGYRGHSGWADGSVNAASDTYVNGFYIGFQLGTEHGIYTNLGTRYNYIAYTFGEYPLKANSGALIHPMTLIQCNDEHSACLPKFYSSGNANSVRPHVGRVGINFINFVIEHYPLITGRPVELAWEQVPNAFVGDICFYSENDENTQSLTNGFWQPNMGKGFRTINGAHLQQGSTAERLSYTPTLQQKYYDEDLNKMLVCTNPWTKVWRDFNGNIIPNA